MTAYNGIEFLREQVESIVTQSEVSIQLFISVDRSADGTYVACKQYETETENIAILEYGEIFGGAAKNFFRLIREVDYESYDYVAFADQDDIWYQDKIKHSIDMLKEKGTDAYSANVIAFWSDGTKRLINKSQPQVAFDYIFEAAGPGCTYVLTNKAALFVKHYLLEHPDLNDFYLHDWLMYAILRHHNFTWYIDSVPKMEYRQHATNQVGANTSMRGLFSRFIEVFSGEGLKSVKLLLKILGIAGVRMDKRGDFIRLAFMSHKFRRKNADKILALLFFCFYSVFGKFK